MPRTARIALPNYPHHVIPRGHNRQAAFADPDDYRYYLANLAIWKTANECKVYAYCLMTNHVHLIIDPGDTPEHLGMLTKRVAGRQTRYVNRLEGAAVRCGRKVNRRVASRLALFAAGIPQGPI